MGSTRVHFRRVFWDFSKFEIGEGVDVDVGVDIDVDVCVGVVFDNIRFGDFVLLHASPVSMAF